MQKDDASELQKPELFKISMVTAGKRKQLNLDSDLYVRQPGNLRL